MRKFEEKQRLIEDREKSLAIAHIAGAIVAAEIAAGNTNVLKLKNVHEHIPHEADKIAAKIVDNAFCL
jgi:hypothetical protein